MRKLRSRGLEPRRGCPHQHLKLACLPISPRPRISRKPSPLAGGIPNPPVRIGRKTLLAFSRCRSRSRRSARGRSRSSLGGRNGSSQPWNGLDRSFGSGARRQLAGRNDAGKPFARRLQLRLPAARFNALGGQIIQAQEQDEGGQSDALGQFGQEGGGRAAGKGRASPHASERPGQTAALIVLDKDEQDEEDAHEDVHDNQSDEQPMIHLSNPFFKRL